MNRNVNFGKLDSGVLTYAPKVLTIGKRAVFCPTDEQYLACGWKRVSLVRPVEPAGEGKHWEADGYDETEKDIVRKWKAVDDDPLPPRKFSKLKIYGAIAQLGAWDAVEAWLAAKTIGGVNGWMAFQLAQEISEGHALFAPLASEAKELLGLSDEQFETLLANCILED